MESGLMHQLLNRTFSHGGEYSDIYFENTRSATIIIENNKVEKIMKGEDTGVGIRLVADGLTSYGYSNDFNPDNLYALSDTVGKISSTGNQEEITLLTGKPLRTRFMFKKEPDSIPVRSIIANMMAANKAAWGIGPNIKQVKIMYNHVVKNVKIATSNKELAEETRIYTLGIVQIVASDGKTLQTAYESRGGLTGYELFDEYPMDILAEAAAKRAVMMLTAREAPSGKMPVVLSSEAGGTMIHEAVGHGLEADLVQGGLSTYAGKKGEMVASPLITVIDDGTLPNKRGSSSFDDEGTNTQRTTLIEKGILQTYMYDRKTAMKDGVSSTGNGRRESYRFKPIPRMRNTFILPGNHSFDDIISSVNKGILVKKMGGGQVNTVNGDFVFEINEGYMLEYGKLGEPIRGATLTGNGPEVLKNISMVGNDFGFAIGTCGKDSQGVPVSDAQPTILINNLTIGGTASPV